MCSVRVHEGPWQKVLPKLAANAYDLIFYDPLNISPRQGNPRHRKKSDGSPKHLNLGVLRCSRSLGFPLFFFHLMMAAGEHGRNIVSGCRYIGEKQLYESWGLPVCVFEALQPRTQREIHGGIPNFRCAESSFKSFQLSHEESPFLM